jgi:YD repeat-containing protein
VLRPVVSDVEGYGTTTRYYPDGKVWKVIDAEGHDTVVNRYNGNGSLKEVEDAKGNVTQYEYNGFMALARTTYPDDTYEELTYDEYRRVIETRGRSGQTIGLSYDGLNRVSGKAVENPYGAPINDVVYQYDLLGRLYKVTDDTATTSSKGREIPS